MPTPVSLERKLGMVRKAKEKHGEDIIPCTPAFTEMKELNLIVFWYHFKLSDGSLTTTCEMEDL